MSWIRFASSAPEACGCATGEWRSTPTSRPRWRRIVPNPADSVAPPADSVAPPAVTVAVCTRDRVEDLARCLDALEAIRYPALDLLVVDNAPATRDAERLVAGRPRVRYVREVRPGLDWARNRAIAEARGEIVAFTDDDVV